MVLINVENIRKKFCNKLHLSLWYGFIDIFSFKRQIALRKHERWVLDDVNFSIESGELIGIVGKNGSGKTTLVRIIMGIYESDFGIVRNFGKIIPLFIGNLALNKYYSGLENYYFMGAVLGYGRKELKKKIPILESFSGLGDDLNAPMGAYSSGMRIKLRFGAIKALEPDVIIIDEALSVSDQKFQEQCFSYFEEFLQKGAIVIISHDLQLIKNQCTRLLVLNQGKIVMDTKDINKGLKFYSTI